MDERRFTMSSGSSMYWSKFATNILQRTGAMLTDRLTDRQTGWLAGSPVKGAGGELLALAAGGQVDLHGVLGSSAGRGGGEVNGRPQLQGARVTHRLQHLSRPDANNNNNNNNTQCQATTITYSTITYSTITYSTCRHQKQFMSGHKPISYAV